MPCQPAHGSSAPIATFAQYYRCIGRRLPVVKTLPVALPLTFTPLATMTPPRYLGHSSADRYFSVWTFALRVLTVAVRLA